MPVDDLLAFEGALYDYLEAHHKDIYETIVSTKDLPEGAVHDAAIQEVKDQSEVKA